MGTSHCQPSPSVPSFPTKKHPLCAQRGAAVWGWRSVHAALSGSAETGDGAAACHREPRWHPPPPSSCTPVAAGSLSAGSLVTSPRNILSATRLGGGFSVGSVGGPKAAERRVLRRHGPGTKPLPTPADRGSSRENCRHESPTEWPPVLSSPHTKPKAQGGQPHPRCRH